MKKALILGRFEPLHKMHLAQIRVVREAGFTPIIGLMDGAMRIIPYERSKAWLETEAEVIRVEARSRQYETIDPTTLPKVDLLAGSNPELIPIAQALGVPYFLWDPAREIWDLDSDVMRETPTLHWKDIALAPRLSIQKRITFVGPESVGKSWFAKKMADEFGGPHIPEYGRPHEKYRDSGDYTGEELALLAQRHGASRRSIAPLAGPVLFEDTDELMTAVWSEMLIGAETPAVEAQVTLPDLYILYHWDTPWEEDKLRYFARADLRRKFYERIEAKLQKHGANYVKVGGTWEEREAQTREHVETVLKSVEF